MEMDVKKLTEFLRSIGAEGNEHAGKTYIAHVTKVFQDLKEWGCGEAVCLAGIFHSIYGTEKFKGFTLPVERRDEIRSLIGERAEQLAYWNCAMCRLSFDKVLERGTPPFVIVDRITGGEFALSPAEFDDLCRLHLCDWLEQLPRCRDWNYRREAYRLMSEHLGGVAREAYELVYSQEVEAMRGELVRGIRL
jgi:hypothetical protein